MGMPARNTDFNLLVTCSKQHVRFGNSHFSRDLADIGFNFNLHVTFFRLMRDGTTA
jgi:hypothetical protein